MQSAPPPFDIPLGLLAATQSGARLLRLAFKVPHLLLYPMATLAQVAPFSLLILELAGK